MKKVRVNVSLDKDLYNFIRTYAEKKRVSVSHLINQYFMKIKNQEN